MEYQIAIYTAATTLIAAFLAAIYSFVSMLVSKDQKTTEFRQNWIDSIREEISQLLAAYGYLATQAERHKTNPTAKEPRKENYLKDCGEKIYEMGERFHRIQLRLNVNGKIEKELLSQLKIIENNVDYEIISSDQASKISAEVTRISQRFLKKEWGRVKRGEPSFYITKWAFLLVLIASFIIALCMLNGNIDVAKRLQIICPPHTNNSK